jgi:hypothetical protein
MSSRDGRIMGLSVLIVEERADVKNYPRQDNPETVYEFVYAVGFAEAVRIASEKDASFGFLVTDVLLNPFHGRDLANRIVGSFPHIKVLFTGSQSPRVLRSAGLLPPNAPFLHKPFNVIHLVKSLDELREKGPSWLDLILFHGEESAVP